MNSPTITANDLTTFFIAYPKSSAPKNPPPTIAKTGATISALKP